MGTQYYGVCKDCKQYIALDKFYAWNAYHEADHSTIDNSDLEEFKNDAWIFRALRLHVFLAHHNGHRVGVLSEYDINNLDDLTEQFPWPEQFKYLVEQIDMRPLVGRIVINTNFGEIYIDHRKNDVNCFRFIDGKRVDTVLLNKQQKPIEII